MRRLLEVNKKTLVQLGNLHHPDIHDSISKIREKLEPLNYIIFTNDLQ